MDEIQKLFIQVYGGTSLMLHINWRTQESWFEVSYMMQKTKHKTFAEAIKAMQEVMKKEKQVLI